MTIYLQPEVRSGLGEDTFWTWFERTFEEATFDSPPPVLGDRDVLLQYATLGKPRCEGGIKIGLLWELYPEMIQMLGMNPEWQGKANRMIECAKHADVCTVSTDYMMSFAQSETGQHRLLPIGVNDCFHPRPMASMRQKHGIPSHKHVFVWVGSKHPMKGDDRLRENIKEHKDAFFIVVWKSARDLDQSMPSNVRQFACIDQTSLAELICCADRFLSTSRLRPWFMCEWEAMMCNVPFFDVSCLDRECEPTFEAAAGLGWRRHDTANRWFEFIEEFR